MAKKEDLFGKLNIKDYNNQLEQILERKNFSADTKNFLLSMLYKIEVSYNDYAIVKNISKTKGEFIAEIIEIIDKQCESIELIKPLDKECKKLLELKEKCIIDKNKKSIISLYNEQVLLYAIFKLKSTECKFKNNMVEKPLIELLSNGEAINAKEVIRDFDGWAWHTDESAIEDVEYNMAFQILTLLIGNDFRTEAEMKKKLAKIFNEEDAQKIYVLICRIAILKYLKNNPNEIDKYKEYNEEIQKNLNKLKNKSKYLDEIGNERKKLESRIKTIDKCFVDVNFLKQEYIKTNKELSDDRKIFSISDFVETLQEEKNVKICELQKFNQKMLPKGYLSEKQDLDEKVQILSVLENENDLYYYILELQSKFLDGIEEKLKQVQSRKDIMNILYILRYYKNIPYNNRQIKDIDELKEKIYKTENMVYNVAYKMNSLNNISINEVVNNDVIREILDTRIIELENIEIIFTAENYQIVLRIYDEDNIEKTLEYNTIEGLVARMNKRFRLFIR